MSARRLPKHVIVTRLKRRGVRQWAIAQRLGITQSAVSKILSREWRGTPAADAVWREVERALARTA